MKRIAIACWLIPTLAAAEVDYVADLVGIYAPIGHCHTETARVAFEPDLVRLGRKSCFIRQILPQSNGLGLDLTACWFGGEVSGDLFIHAAIEPDRPITLTGDVQQILFPCEDT